jgi:hypothetical protein
VGRLEDEDLVLDLRTVEPVDDGEVVTALRTVTVPESDTLSHSIGGEGGEGIG